MLIPLEHSIFFLVFDPCVCLKNKIHGSPLAGPSGPPSAHFRRFGTVKVNQEQSPRVERDTTPHVLIFESLFLDVKEGAPVPADRYMYGKQSFD